MDLDTFLATPRWEILKIIADSPSSPIEIAKKLGTTVSYISQQLKLLDAAGLVKKEKTGFIERGKPRSVFSISEDLLHLTILTKDLSIKKKIDLTGYHKVILKIWSIENVSFHYFFEKLFWEIEKDLGDVDKIFIEDVDVPKMFVVSESQKLKINLTNFVRSFGQKVICNVISSSQVKKMSEKNMVKIYDKTEGGIM
ncbi:MAG: ArsR family transcriptional regulator [Candidatus Pacearchaeota archaeon]|nr:ArsR family transcriptional regulator [Candidatus Pacearchaeota archaeon]